MGYTGLGGDFSDTKQSKEMALSWFPHNAHDMHHTPQRGRRRERGRRKDTKEATTRESPSGETPESDHSLNTPATLGTGSNHCDNSAVCHNYSSPFGLLLLMLALVWSVSGAGCMGTALYGLRK